MKKILSIAVAFLFTLTLASCNNQSGNTTASQTTAVGQTTDKEPNSTTSPAEPVELTIWLAGTGDPAYDNTYKSVFNSYVDANPHVSYEMSFIPWGEYFTKLNTGMAGGAAADLFMLGYGQMGTVQSMDYLLPLDEYIPDDWDGWEDILPNIIEACKKEGVMYGMFSPSTRVYFYRKDIAQQQGVTAEDLKVDSYEELVSLAEKMTVKDDKGNTIMSGLSITTSQNSPEQQFLVNMTYQTDQAGLWNADYSPKFNTPEGVKAMQNLVELYKSGVSLPSDPNDITLPIASGLAAMTLSPEAAYNQANDSFPGQIGVVDCSLGSLLIGNYMSVNADTPHQEESVKLLLHMFSKESSQKFAEGMGQYSGRKSLNENYISIKPEEYSKVVKAYEKAVPLGDTMNPHFNKMISIFRTAIEEIYAGADPQQRLDQAAEEYKAAMQG